MAQRTCSLPDCDRKHRARGWCVTHYNQLALTPEQWHPTRVVACVVCSTPVTRRAGSRYEPTCSVACRTIVQFGQREAQRDPYVWRTDVLKRARQHDCRIVDVFDREDIFERDDWACYLCGIQCHQPDPYDHQAATIDHVVPLHLHGEHSRANVRTACLSCNTSKQARISQVA